MIQNDTLMQQLGSAYSEIRMCREVIEHLKANNAAMQDQAARLENKIDQLEKHTVVRFELEELPRYHEPLLGLQIQISPHQLKFGWRGMMNVSDAIARISYECAEKINKALHQYMEGRL